MAGGVVRTIVTRFVADISQWSQQMNQVNSTMARVRQKMTAVGAGMTAAITLPLVAVGGAFTKMAMDAVESESLFGVAMGKMTNQARSWSESLSDAFGINAYNIRRNIAGFQMLATSMGVPVKAAFDMNRALVERAYDLASAYNQTNEQVMQDLNAIYSGESEPLKKYGAVLTETVLKSYAMRNGLIKQGEAMSEQQKILVRYLAFMEMTKLAHGDLARTIDSPSNKLKRLKEQMSELGIEIGQKLIPVVSKLMGYANNLLDGWNKLNPATQDTILAILGLTAAVGPLVLAIGAATTALSFMMANPVVAAIAGIAALVGTVAIATNGFGLFEQSQKKAQDRLIQTTAEMIRQKKAANDLGSAVLAVSYIEAKQAKERYNNELMKEALVYESIMAKRSELERRNQSKLFKPGTSMQPEIDAVQKQLEGSMKKMEESRKKMSQAQTIMDEWSKVQTPKLNTPSTVNDLKNEFKSLGTAGTEAYDKITDKIRDFIDAVRSQAREFSNFVGIFEKATQDQPINMERWINRLKGQLNAIKTYQTSLATLQAKANQGLISQQLYNDLAALGPSAAKQLQVVAKASNKQLQQVNSLFGQKSNIASSLAYDSVRRDMATQANVVQIVNNFNGGAKDEDIVKLSDKLTDLVIKKLKRKGLDLG
ncbi:MAG TPA: hypothetical protein VIO64_10665 [Pseudobacteroides sp.]|uniref:hypothetical protein n=1 Tax=Pseudobacteroides sp. TaxID=1968840 RepID=UPI002F94F937